MEEKQNVLLKIGAVLIMAAGLICGIISVINAIGTISELSSMNSALLDSYVASQTQGMFNGADAVGMVQIIAIVTIILTVVMVVLDIIVGFMGLSKSKQPASWRFFLVWGIVLLIIGLIGLGSPVSLRGIFALLCGVVGPVLYIVGAVQLNRLAKAGQSTNM